MNQPRCPKCKAFKKKGVLCTNCKSKWTTELPIFKYPKKVQYGNNLFWATPTGVKKKEIKKSVKHLILRSKNKVYIQKDIKAYYCDFCGAEDVLCFESEFRNDEHTEKSDMQICFDCIKQLNKFL